MGWILVFYLMAANGHTLAIEQVGEFASMDACLTAGNNIRTHWGDAGVEQGFDCIDQATGETAVSLLTKRLDAGDEP